MADVVTGPPATFDRAPARHVLTETEFDVLWSALRLGPAPIALRMPSPGRTRGERARIVAAGWQGLRGRGLADAGGPAPEPARLLGLLARPQRQLELRAWSGRPVRAVAAERDGDGALVVRSGGSVVLSAAGTPAHAVCATLAPHPRPRGRAVTLPTDALAAILDDPAGAAVPDLDPDDDALVRGLLRGRSDRAQVAAVVHDRWGSPHRPVGHLTLLDTPRGRYRLSRGPADDGTEWSTLAPVGMRSLHTLLTDLLTSAQEAMP